MPSWKALRPDGTCFEGEGVEGAIRPLAHTNPVYVTLEGRGPFVREDHQALMEELSAYRKTLQAKLGPPEVTDSQKQKILAECDSALASLRRRATFPQRR